MGVFPCQLEGFCVDVNPSQLNILQISIIQKQQIIHQPAGDGGQTRMGLYKATKLLLKFRKSFPDQHEQRSVEQPGFQGVREEEDVMGYLLHNVQPIAWKPAFTWRLSKTPAFFSTLKTFLTMGMSGLISNPLYKSSTMAEDCLASCNRRFRRSA